MEEEIKEVSLNDINLSDLSKALNRAKQENIRYKELKSEIDTANELIISVIDVLKQVQKKLNPAMSLQSGIRRSKIEVTEIINQIYEKMKAGTHITRAFMFQAYPDIRADLVHHYFAKLEKLPGVKRTKDGNKLRLYI